MRTYLVVVDESPEAQIALRFAARRAVKTGGGVEILALIPKPDFVQWGGVMATIEEEARQRAAGLSAAKAAARRTTRQRGGSIFMAGHEKSPGAPCILQVQASSGALFTQSHLMAITPSQGASPAMTSPWS